MVTTSLLDIDVDEVLGKVERLAHVKLPRAVIEVSLEPLSWRCFVFASRSLLKQS